MSDAGGSFYLLDGANELAGLRAAIWLALRWPAVRRELVAAPGYLAHRVWFAWPWTLGLTTWWVDEASAYRYAHLPEHRRVWAWGTEPGHTRGGWLAHYRYVRGGPLWGNGVRAMMARFQARVPAADGHPPRPVPPRRPPTG